MTVSIANKVESLLETYRDLIQFAEVAKQIATESPTSSKNAQWAHVEFHNVSNPSALLLYIREQNPEYAIKQLSGDIELLQFVRGSDNNSLPTALIDWVDQRFEAIFKKD